MSKRRVFDIDFPDEEPAPEQPSAEPVGRRGPMASAIGENADALRERQQAEAAIREENDRLAHEHVRLKKAGLVTDLIPIDAIRAEKLARDRKPGRDEELEELKLSIREVGLSNPIRVEQDGDTYELVQGYRRLTAYRELFEETGEEIYATIPAGLTAKGETLETLYRRMVDENMVRKDISFAEMAELARAYVQDPDTATDDIDDAVKALFGSAGRQKRSYIKHFVTLLDAIGSHLKFAPQIPRALGLQLAKRLSEEDGLAPQIRHRLTASFVSTAEGELEVLKGFATPSKPGKQAAAPSKPTAKTTFRQTVPAGTVRCAASDGRVELRMKRDFSEVDRQRMEAAVAAFFRELDPDQD
ncbi:ParB/RepB/Spo0J family partition protein [Qingshengfaniella alkalisoli]|uniref:Replication protein n=1 Tax=Qingshengfaniella alkalisoli TaxID=2599296 RepID=A0A5B8J0M9_9RHOB|nr:ParB/RepB/Spo0J family partition protein [Qingshengfaniella alkalisoli]QDY70731.1 replication protein [Qingshengfaniella alkalisoli]